ncbi:hypothetical protein VL15_06990 [Burkholderia cepacia]|uniref:Uncharacterized protein n=1 Tax=Burkholderia cepacia TaxID=292 RepID=A0A0J5XF02_BURCE|nr:hypothetical protein [Burkholderia cepacia]KML61352.1 hypothetical protein VL15_06990 [Burkholderia cepacia]
MNNVSNDGGPSEHVVMHPLDTDDAAVAAGVDARLDVWRGMSHGFAGGIGKLKASAQALDAIGLFLVEQLQAGGGARVRPRSAA